MLLETTSTLTKKTNCNYSGKGSELRLSCSRPVATQDTTPLVVFLASLAQHIDSSSIADEFHPKMVVIN